MSKYETIKGVLKIFFQLIKEDWDAMDHKLIRITIGAIVFILMALFWLYFLRSITPF
ncbi:MAG: hypothetical protein QXD48_03635 [Candidatus Aenigmatarchaeota archaeon]